MIVIMIDWITRQFMGFYYWLVYSVFPTTTIPLGTASDPPIVLIPGLIGFSTAKMGGLRYFNFDTSRTQRRLIFPDIPPIGDNTTRAHLVRAYLLGGTAVDSNGKTHVFSEAAYPEWSKEHPIDIIAHSQGTLTGYELLRMAPDGAVRTFVRVCGIGTKMDIVQEVVRRLDTAKDDSFLEPFWMTGIFSLLIYSVWAWNKINWIIPSTTRLLDTTAVLSENASPIEVARTMASGLHYQALTPPVHTTIINIVCDTSLLTWPERIMLLNPITVVAVMLETYLLGRLDLREHDGIVDTDEQRLDGAIRVVCVHEAATRANTAVPVELTIATHHVTTLSWVADGLLVPRASNGLETAFEIMNLMRD
jgi:pimeloyl-ACP methyl ester carboxylesterase